MDYNIMFLTQEEIDKNGRLAWGGATVPGFYFPDPQYGRICLQGPYATERDASVAAKLIDSTMQIKEALNGRR